MAVGADQGGSIRNPSARCGIVGLKPTLGLVPYTGIFPMEFTLDHVGPMARTVYDVALLLEVCMFFQMNTPSLHFPVFISWSDRPVPLCLCFKASLRAEPFL